MVGDRVSFDRVLLFPQRGSATDTDGCSAAIALLTGRQLFLARLGDSVGLIDEKLGDGSRISRVRSASDGTQGEALEQVRVIVYQHSDPFVGELFACVCARPI